MFGLLATIALYIYEIRNSDLYDDLISRGRRIEYELGVDTGHFRGRPRPASWLVTHGTAIKLVYLVTIAAWGAAFIAVTRQLISAQ
jgi:hypothetical protein